jgi:hypothetical protein
MHIGADRETDGNPESTCSYSGRGRGLKTCKSVKISRSKFITITAVYQAKSKMKFIIKNISSIEVDSSIP